MSVPAAAAAATGMPVPDTQILADRPVRPGTLPGDLSVFRDDRWNLTPAIFEPNTRGVSISFARIPGPFRQHVKLFAWLLLNHQGDGVARFYRMTVERPAVRSVLPIVRHLGVFTVWLHARGIRQLADVSPGDLDLYADHVKESEVSQGTAEDLLVAVRWCWSYRALLPAEARLPQAPPWKGERMGTWSATGPAASPTSPRASRRRSWNPCCCGRCGW